MAATAVRKAEYAAYRAKYGAWTPSDLQQLKGMPPSQQVTASLWVGFFLPDSATTLASIAPLAAAAKAPVKQALTTNAISTLWDDPHSPLVLVKGKPAAILALGFHPAVDSAEVFTGAHVRALGDPGDGQEKIDAHMSTLVSTHGNLTNDSVILQWDVSVPGTEVTQHTDASGRENDKMAYIPLNLSRSFTNLVQSDCNTTMPEKRGECAHTERTLGIIAGRADTQYSPARGFGSYLPNLTSIGVATLGDPGGPGDFQRIAQVAGSSPRPDVQSWSISFGGLSCYTSTANNMEKYVDYWSVVRPTLNVMSVGNFSDDPDCKWTVDKLRNAILVGGYDDGNVTPAVPKMYTSSDWTVDGYSLWRSPYDASVPGYNHGDRRDPQVSAVGSYVQSFDQYWRTTSAMPSCVGWPYTNQYQRCDAPTDYPEYDEDYPYGCLLHKWSGTSFSTPQVAAVAAYAVREAKCIYNTDWLKAIETARALVIASATRNITVRSLSGQDAVWPLVTGYSTSYNQRQWAAGAGGVDAGSLSWILHSKCTRPGQSPGGSFGGLDFYFDPDNPPGPQSKPAYVPPGVGNARCRVAIAWNPLTNCTSGSSPQCTEAQGYDFDVCLRRNATGQLIGCAASWDNNYEYMNVPCYGNEGYTVEILPYSGTGHTTAKVGWAFIGTWE